ncbi:hypothetical protein BCR44DRAFT_1446558 [Catenaria anguillulae PL171]|uniref:P-loop containing nucleoside triphosphate hydrolase protein n=1 Tax=Catenaria anguillulae PL171 TaxID=765915 RepID=A0A1Y2H661_9FUNG|nr:hypothetical protein BCR44DRAFT_1446558 [Catenaria anguillulae PL171]
MTMITQRIPIDLPTDTPPWAYASRLAPVTSAVTTTAPLLVVATCYAVREISWFFRRKLHLHRLSRASPAGARRAHYLPHHTHARRPPRPSTAGTVIGPSESASAGVGGLSISPGHNHESQQKRNRLLDTLRASTDFEGSTGASSTPLPGSSPTIASDSDYPDGDQAATGPSSPGTRTDFDADADDDYSCDSSLSDAPTDDADRPNSPVFSPPKWLTRFALVFTSAQVLSHAFALIWLALTHIHSHPTSALDFFPWLLAVHVCLTLSWIQTLGLLIVRRNRWDRTWVVAGLWAIALASSLCSLYNHLLYWGNPIPGFDAVYSHVSWLPALLLPQILDVVFPLSLSGIAVARFYKHSVAAREVAAHAADEEEQQPLLRPRSGTSGPSARRRRRATRSSTNPQHDPASTAAAVANGTAPTQPSTPETKFKPPKTFADYSAKFRKLAPFIWPQADRYLQWLVVVCIFLLVVGRVVNVLLPIQAKVLVDKLTVASSSTTDRSGTPSAAPLPDARLPWEAILLFVLLRFLQGGVGLVSTTQDLLWMPIGQYTTRAISQRMFTHLHNLSHRFHLTRKTGEILRVQDRGVSSIVTLLSTILFNIVPTLIDIAIAVVFFGLQFDVWFSLIVGTTMVLYIVATVVITEVRTKHRRRSNALENAMQAKAVDSLLNFEVVKLYNNETFESQQYAKAMADYQAADWISSLTSSWLSMTQNWIIQVGLLCGALLCAHRVVVQRVMSVGDFVLFLSYITQLYGPLNDFGKLYRQLQKNFVDMEKMLDLLAQMPEVRDSPRTISIDPCSMQGHVRFENVTFAYDPRVPTLRNISFEIPAGKTVALVGSSGSGKSTILRLLFRFYDVQAGRITVDGIDIRSMRQRDLRSLIGVVPQDTVLFNDTIQYNVRYGRTSATDQEVEAAARAAQIHDRIMTFPDQYETKVGERGMRLSGGEKQRVAISRMLLKNPVINFLDEATSALDTTTERVLQNQLKSLTENKTTLIIAHRLSTILHADIILVVHAGEIVQRGSHDQLISDTSGMYFDMWLKQLQDNEDLLQNANVAPPGLPSTAKIPYTPPSTQDAATTPMTPLLVGADGHPQNVQPQAQQLGTSFSLDGRSVGGEGVGSALSVTTASAWAGAPNGSGKGPRTLSAGAIPWSAPPRPTGASPTPSPTVDPDEQPGKLRKLKLGASKTDLSPAAALTGAVLHHARSDEEGSSSGGDRDVDAEEEEELQEEEQGRVEREFEERLIRREQEQMQQRSRQGTAGSVGLEADMFGSSNKQ